MRIQLRPIGQRLAIVLPDSMLDQLGIGADTVLDVSFTKDNQGVEIRAAPEEPHLTERFSPIQARLSPGAEKLLVFLKAHEGTFFHPKDLPSKRKVNKDRVFVACGRAAFFDPHVLIVRGRIGYLADPDRVFEPDWSFAAFNASKSSRAAEKDRIVLRLFEANPSRLLDRDEVYGGLHRQWQGDGGIMLRDVDMCAARLAFAHWQIVVRHGQVGLVEQ